MGPFGPWEVISQVPAAFAGSSAALNWRTEISNKPHAIANAKKQAILLIEASPLGANVKFLDASRQGAVTKGFFFSTLA
jgi:hypothetical protein